MTYADFKQSIRAKLQAEPSGMTWRQLKTQLRFPYARPCPEWTRLLEREIHLVRRKSAGNAFIWALGPKAKKQPDIEAGIRQPS